MANEIVSVKSIARAVLPRLIDNLVFPNLIYKDYSSDVARGKGDTVLVRKPAMLEAKEFDMNGGTVETQDMKEDAVEVKLDKMATVDVELGAWESITEDDLDRIFYEPAAVALAEKINRDGLGLYADIYQVVGTPGAVPTSLDAFANAAYALDAAKVPTAPRRAIWSAQALAKFRTIPDVVNAEKSGTTTALRNGSIGTIFGIDNYMSQATPVHTAGNLATTTGVTLTVGDTANGGKSLTINSSSSISLKSVKAGDLLKIGGSYYTVTSGGMGGSTTVQVEISPAYTGSTGEAVTFVADAKDKAAASYTNNLIFHPNAFAFVTRPLITPAGVESYTTSYNGVSLRATRGYDMKTKKEMLSLDVLYGYKTVYPELAVRYLG